MRVREKRDKPKAFTKFFSYTKSSNLSIKFQAGFSCIYEKYLVIWLITYRNNFRVNSGIFESFRLISETFENDYLILESIKNINRMMEIF